MLYDDTVDYSSSSPVANDELRHFADLNFRQITFLFQISINIVFVPMRYGLMNIRKLMAERQEAV